ncbi:MAG TPA: hypothetical protein VGE36_14260 [Roseateles sp.]
MRVTLDKNGEPFGFSEACCNQQMRVGGDKRRVAAFVARYPWAAGPAPAAAPAPTVTATAPAPVPAPARRQVADPFGFLKGEQHA